MATRPLLVVVLCRKTLYFGDETTSRRRFVPGNLFFWRRNHFSSSFCAVKPLFLATKLVLVVVLCRETSLFGDETPSRRLFKPQNRIFWRRNHFSSSFCAVKPLFLATKLVLVVFLSRETSLFWRRNLFSSSFCAVKPRFLATRPLLVVFLNRKTLFFGDETFSRRLFEAGNSLFGRRDHFSSSF
ncbi:hypothetical protein NST11_01645 [Caldifermentibacillus hisashii]|uniref:hypothetical protein n=1 Tax=Caldifermentibacillus hisashii TaxID=996558 RepID=UPI0031B7E82E